MLSVTDRTCAPHDRWGEGCDAWRLLATPGLAVAEERVPPGGHEVWHRHARAQQFFYVLSGTATLAFDGAALSLAAGQGAHVPPGHWHRFENAGPSEVVFLVVSAPATAGDREDDPSRP